MMRGAEAAPNHLIDQSGRGRQVVPGWNDPTSSGRFSTLAAAPQVMHGR